MDSELIENLVKARMHKDSVLSPFHFAVIVDIVNELAMSVK